MDVRVGLWRRLSTKGLMLLNCGIGEDSWESHGLQGYPTSPTKGNQSWIFIGTEYSLKLQYFGHLMWRTDSFEKTLMLGRIESGRRRGWQSMRWMAWLTQWTWVWVNSESWWWTGKPGVLQSSWLQRAGHDWATELNWTELNPFELYLDFWSTEMVR